MSYDPDLFHSDVYVKQPSVAEQYAELTNAVLFRTRTYSVVDVTSFNYRMKVLFVTARKHKYQTTRCDSCYAPFIFGDLSWRNTRNQWQHDCQAHQRERRSLVNSLM